MILGLGVDLVDVVRFQRVLDRFGDRLLEKLFQPSEINHCNPRRSRAECLAGGFAVKEAFLKALGTGLSRGIRWLDMEVVRKQGMPPRLSLRGRALEILEELGGESLLVSISHEAGLALATVLIQGNPKKIPERAASLERALKEPVR
jgi:holo-[acyl-carrier protein] synthase